MSPRPALPAALGVPVLALLAGAAQAASFAPLQWWPLQILGLAILVSLVQRAPGLWRAMAAGWAFGFGWLACGLWWLYISMHDFGGLPAPLAAAAVAALAGLLALYYALATALWWWLCGRLSPNHARPSWPIAASALAFAGCWTLAELARAVLFTGFPWIAGGYVHTDSPLAAWAPWIGVYGIGAVAAWGAAAVGLVLPMLLRGSAAIGGAIAMRTMAAPMLLMLGGSLLPQTFTEPAGSLRVSLVQTNVPQDLKFDPERSRTHLQSLADQLASARGQLVITPESVLPLPLAFMPAPDWQALTAGFADASAGRAALIGVFLGNDTEGYVNSMVGVPPADPASADLYRYGKRHLLPFGEFIPPGFGWFVTMMNIPLSDQAHGQSEAAWAVAGQRLRPLICYEDLFGEDFASSVVGDQAATVLVNTANLAWFGRHMVQDQHLQFSRMRALEFQRPVLRATNTGATAVVDHQGEVTQRLPPLVHATLEGRVEGRSGSTPYARWLAALGLAPLVAACLAALAVALALRRGGHP